MEPQLYMWIGVRESILRRHDFYLQQLKERVLSQFENIEEQAENYFKAEYERLASLPFHEDIDMDEIAGWADSRGQEFYGLLHDLKKQIFFGAIAGMYHQWEKELREFFEMELRHSYKQEDILKFAWNENVFNILKEFGWNSRSINFFKEIDACRLIVNVHKHGKGSSLRDLAKSYPEYLKNPLEEIGGRWATSETNLQHDWLAVSEQQFEKLASSFRQFWEAFPERLFLKTGA